MIGGARIQVQHITLLNRTEVCMTCCHAMLEDNTCHFGVNNFFSDLGLKSKHAPDTQLFFPADVHQTSKVVEAVFWQSGLRFIYTTRSKADRCRPKRMIKDGFHSSLWT